jgi:hypothetical protein
MGLAMREEDKDNTLNICLGHLPFPCDFHKYVDLMIAPRIVGGPCHVAVIDDSYFGEHGSSLSEYAQLLWLYDNFDTIVDTYDYVRIFQYRRFVAHEKIGRASSHEWARWIPKDKLRKYSKEFSRISTAELFNSPHTPSQGVLGQYDSYHVLEDIINFSKFLLESGVLDSKQTESFLTSSVLIPACNMGTFRSTTLRQILMSLRDAAEFLKTGYFIPRVGYQRRVLGFLLERLNSYLILARIQSGLSDANFGHHIILSDGPLIGITTEPLTERNALIAERGALQRKIAFLEGAKRFLKAHLPEGAKRFLKAHLTKSG